MKLTLNERPWEKPNMKPMTAKTYENAKSLSRFVDDTDLCTQPKLDGVRCISWFRPKGHKIISHQWKEKILKSDHVQISSRTEKFLGASHVTNDAEKFLAGVGEEMYLDGELYIHGKRFQDIQSIVSRCNHPDKESLEYHIYDCYFPSNPQLDFDGRSSWLADTFDKWATSKQNVKYRREFGSIRRVETLFEVQQDELETILGLNIHDGYEGIMIRDPSSVYTTGKRSPGLLKYKKWHDEEFAVIAIEEGKGKFEGAAILVCEVNNRTFRVTSPGTMTQKHWIWDSHEDYIGKMITVKYQEKTADGIPRFPIALSFRADL